MPNMSPTDKAENLITTPQGYSAYKKHTRQRTHKDIKQTLHSIGGSNNQPIQNIEQGLNAGIDALKSKGPDEGKTQAPPEEQQKAIDNFKEKSKDLANFVEKKGGFDKMGPIDKIRCAFKAFKAFLAYKDMKQSFGQDASISGIKKDVQFLQDKVGAQNSQMQQVLGCSLQGMQHATHHPKALKGVMKLMDSSKDRAAINGLLKSTANTHAAASIKPRQAPQNRPEQEKEQEHANQGPRNIR